MKKVLLGSLIICVLALLLFIKMDAAQPNAAWKRSTRVKIGDTKAQVRAVMGNPVSTSTNYSTFPTFVSAECWGYGSLLDWSRPFSRQFPWIAPLNFRFFGPEANDVAIDFDTAGRVSNIRLPAN